MKSHLVAAASVILLATVSLHATVINKTARTGPKTHYDIKSGIVTYDRLDTQKGVTTHTKEIVYFDDYGDAECHEIYDVTNGTATLREGRFGKYEMAYNYSMITRRAGWNPYDGGGVFPRFDFKEGSPSLKKDEHYQEIAGETICGRVCDGVSCTPTTDGEITCYGWKHIIMKLVSDYPAFGNRMVLVATSVEEDAAIPDSKFALPDGVKTEGGK